MYVPLFGSANQLLAALVPDRTGSLLKNNRTHRLDALHTDVCHARRDVHRTHPEDDRSGENIAGGQATFLVDGLQFIVAVLLMVLGVLVAFSCLKKLFGKNRAGRAA